MPPRANFYTCYSLFTWWSQLMNVSSLRHFQPGCLVVRIEFSGLRRISGYFNKDIIIRLWWLLLNLIVETSLESSRDISLLRIKPGISLSYIRHKLHLVLAEWKSLRTDNIIQFLDPFKNGNKMMQPIVDDYF